MKRVMLVLLLVVCLLSVGFAETVQDYITPYEIRGVSNSIIVTDSVMWNTGETLPINYNFGTFIKDDGWRKPVNFYNEDFYGDCEDYAVFTASILENKQIPYVVITGDHVLWFIRIPHSWVEANINGEYKIIDYWNVEDKDKFRFWQYEPEKMFSKKLRYQEYDEQWISLR